jgi:hypothetical protein
MTDTDQETLKFIRQYMDYHHLFPSYSVMATHFEVTRQCIYSRISRLCDQKVLVKKDRGTYELKKGKK